MPSLKGRLTKKPVTGLETPSENPDEFDPKRLLERNADPGDPTIETAYGAPIEPRYASPDEVPAALRQSIRAELAAGLDQATIAKLHHLPVEWVPLLAGPENPNL